jgi:hypothetical protein
MSAKPQYCEQEAVVYKALTENPFQGFVFVWIDVQQKGVT